MKKLNLKFFGIIISLLMVMLATTTSLTFAATGDVAQGGWNALLEEDSETPPEVVVSAIQGPGLKIDFTLPGFRLETVTHNGLKFDKILFDNQSSLGEGKLGAPNVPMLRRTIGILNDSTLKVTIDSVDFVEFTNINLEPLQEDLLEPEISEKKYEYDKAIYSKNDFFPDNWAKASTFGNFHGIALGDIEILPVRYNPVRKSAQIARSLSITVEFIEKTPNTAPAAISPHLENIYKGMLLNYDLMRYPVKKSSFGNTGTDYLILTDPDFVNSPSLKQFADFYRNMGMNVEVKNVAEIGKRPTEIKDYIKSVYGRGDDPELDYVLLVADIDVIPFNESKKRKGDIWYAWLDGRDHVGDVGLGRFPVKDEAELKMIVDKTLAFSNNGTKEAWKNRSVLIAHKQGYPDRYTQVHRRLFDQYQTLLEVHKLEGGDQTSNWSNVDIAKEINSGSLVVTYRGQGNSANWSSWNQTKQSFEVADVEKLSNGTKTPIVFSIACNTTDISTTAKTIGESFVIQNQGAVAYFGATDSSITRINNELNEILFSGIYDKKIETIGDLYNYSNATLFEKNKDNKNLYLYLWLGDPALRFEPKPQPQPVDKFTLTVEIKGTGTVAPNGGLFDKGTVVNLDAKAGNGVKFDRWEVDASGTWPSINITMDRNKKVVAYFSDFTPPVPVGDIATDDLEEYGWNGGKGAWVGAWTKTGDVRKNQKKPFSGTRYARLRKDGKLERVVDLSKSKNPVLQFAARVKGFEATDKAYVRVSSDGKSYTEVMNFSIDQSNNAYKEYSISLARFPKTANFHIVFESKMDQIQDFWYLDKFVIVEK